MVERECRVEKAPGTIVEIRLSYRDSRRTELRPVKVVLSTQVIWLLLSILQEHTQKHPTWGSVRQYEHKGLKSLNACFEDHKIFTHSLHPFPDKGKTSHIMPGLHLHIGT